MPPLSAEERSLLLTLARDSVERRLRDQAEPAPPAASLTPRLQDHAGAFVTLHDSDGELRGCVGLPFPAQPLFQAVVEAAASAAVEDPRFAPVTLAELPRLKIEISVLTPPEPIAASRLPEGVIPGVHGLLISQGQRRGLLLPQVATEYGWDAARFLTETCRKAGLPSDAWKQGATVETFTAEILSEPRQ